MSMPITTPPGFTPPTLCGRSIDGEHIRLSVEGLDWQVGQVQTQLKRLTVGEHRAKDGSGELLVPLTWAMVTQIAGLMEDCKFGWRPDPWLNKWIEQEFTRRHTEYGSPADLAFDTGNLGWTPMPHQLAGAYVGGLNERFFFCDDMRPQPVDTPILTAQGWKSLGMLKPGDRVYAEDGHTTAVTEVKFFGQQPVYRVTLSDRTWTHATGDHPWHVFTANHRVRPDTPAGQAGYVMTTDQLLAKGMTDQAGNSKWFLPQQPVVLAGTPADDLSVDPYAYGALLGDGSLGGGTLSISCPDDDIRDRVREAAFALGTSSRDFEPQDKCAHTDFHRDGDLNDRLYRLGALVLSGEKYVHAAYLRGNVSVRRELLRGLLDTDGTVIKTGAGVEFSSASPMLSAAVAFLGRSLGAVATESDPQVASYIRDDGVRAECQDKHRVLLRFPADGPNPFWCGRKASVWQVAAAKVKRPKPPRAIHDVMPAGVAEVCCIRIEHESHVYLTDTALIPTHNTGKTRTALLTMAEMEARGKNPFPAFVVCPASVVDPWMEELEAAFPQWPAIDYRGAKRFKLSSRYKIYVMSWPTFTRDMKHEHDLPPLLKFIMPQTVVYDEAHALCNTKTKQSTAAKQIARVTPFVFPMSGTPITRDVGGFWTAMNVLDIRSFPDEDKYKGVYTDRFHGEYADIIDGISKSKIDEFHLLLKGSMRRTSKSDVNPDLLPPCYSTRAVDIPAAYRAAYDEMAEDMIAHMPDGDEPLEVMTTLTQLQRLTQLASSSCDVEVTMELDENENSPTFGEEVPRYHVTMQEPSWKIDELMAIMDEARGSPLTVFSPHTQLVKMAGARAEREGYKVGYITGQESHKLKTKYRHMFQNGELDLMCCNVTAGGVGLTLNRGDTVIFLERPWAYWQAHQAEARVDDVINAKQVYVIDIVARNTVESRVRQALKDKARQLSELVQDPRIVTELLGGQPIKV